MALSLSPAARHQISNGLTAFSLGTLCFIRRWYDLENLQPRGLDYFRNAPGDLTLLGATIVAAALLAAVFWGAWRVVERQPPASRLGSGLRTFAHVSFVLVLMYPIESVRRYWNTQTDHFDYGSNISLWVVEAILTAGILMLLLGNRRILAPARRVALLLLLLFPALMIDFLTNRLGAEQIEVYAPRPSAPRLQDRPAGSPRAIIMVFDELDQQLVFDRRPKYLTLPALDRLREESVSSDHATETATFTAIALPSLISGRIFGNAQALNADTLNLWPRGSSQAVDWRTEPSVFTRARELGVNAALVGWHHPYCRILGSQLVNCFALPSYHSTAALAEEAQASQDGVWKTVAWMFRWQAVNVRNILTNRDPGSEDLRDIEIQRGQQQQYFQIRDRAYRFATDPSIGLLFLHIPAPHMFPIYNRREQSFHLAGPLDYFDNVALVDRTVAELRQALDQAGLSDRTALLLTADHGLRPGAWIGRMGWTEELDRLTGRRPPSTVPFILKLPGQSRSAIVEKSFSNVAAGDLALAILDGKVATTAQAVAWMNQLASDDGGVQAAAPHASVRSAQ
jgi:Type I phosphodiesterase / nucleotide pyrophosphatase